MADNAAILALTARLTAVETAANARIAALESQVQQLQEDNQQLRNVVMVALNSAVDTLVDAGRYAQAQALSVIASQTERALANVPSRAHGVDPRPQVPSSACQPRRCAAPDDAGHWPAPDLGAGAQRGDSEGHPGCDAAPEHPTHAPAGSVAGCAPLLNKDPELRNALIRFNWHVYAACNHCGTQIAANVRAVSIFGDAV